ncbi:MAG: hypothetical protein Q8936_01080 [Bacillota bacterium]|nr:hypothetical protein [Bacillota bacterium]
MGQCPFLTTSAEKIDCFKECAFYNCSYTGGDCPFRNLTGMYAGKVKKMYDFYFCDSDEVYSLEEDYEEIGV